MRNRNDIGPFYLEIDKCHNKLVLYVDGKPVVQHEGSMPVAVPSGCYKVNEKK